MLATACADAQQQGTPREQSRRQSPPRTSQAAASTTCIVARIADGDTIGCAGGARVRLLLIDTPELDQGSFGRTAAATLRRLAPVGTSLRLEFDVRRTDQYDRLLAYAWTADSTMLNEQMVRQGMAVVLVYPPNVKYVERLRAAADLAKRRKIGLWATSAFECAPRDHRAGRC
jgi:endonuclease YncB( thermonuclease family)